jgi:hypothetical protein
VKSWLLATVGAWPFSQADKAFSGAQETIYAIAARHAYQMGRVRNIGHGVLPPDCNNVNIIR